MNYYNSTSPTIILISARSIFMEKFLKSIRDAQKKIQTLDHMIYITFPLIKDKRILIKVLTETKNAIASCINAILQYDYLYKRVDLSLNPKTNFRTFQNKCAPRYGITKEEIMSIIELFEIVERHKQSSMEFLKNEKMIVLSESMNQEIITLEKIKRFFNLAKDITKKISAQIH